MSEQVIETIISATVYFCFLIGIFTGSYFIGVGIDSLKELSHKNKQKF